ncbi:MAG TPA: hypothetical protein VEY12_10600 [Thermoplasmata archaeon]|nr:hypothetical protein [Thermoplasmata archaeon]
MSAERDAFLLLRRLAPEDHGLTVFDADTQETSYGTFVVDGLPLIFDTHRKETWFVSTAELLTEIGAPARVTPEEVERFAKVAEHAGAQAIPYSACFFKGNLHVYAYYGPVRGLDISTVGESVAAAERKLDAIVRGLWSDIPGGVREAQAELLSGRRKARYPEDLEVLLKRKAAAPG